MVETGASEQISLTSELKHDKYEKCYSELKQELSKLGAAATEQ
jgi:hypothetical protein